MQKRTQSEAKTRGQETEFRSQKTEDEGGCEAKGEHADRAAWLHGAIPTRSAFATRRASADWQAPRPTKSNGGKTMP